MTAVLTPSSLPFVLPRRVFFGSHGRVQTLAASELRRVKEFEAENAKRKRIVAELSLDRVARKDVISRKRDGRLRSARGCMG